MAKRGRRLIAMRLRGSDIHAMETLINFVWQWDLSDHPDVMKAARHVQQIVQRWDEMAKEAK